MSRRSAFTLVELLAVIVVLGLLATVAVTSLGGTMDRYRLSRGAEAVEMFDARARRLATRLRTPVETTVQRQRRQLTIHHAAEEERFRLPGGVEIGQIRIGRRITVGNAVQIPFNHQGNSPTYALRIDRGKMSRWLVVLGISGQVIVLDNEGEVDEVLSL